MEKEKIDLIKKNATQEEEEYVEQVINSENIGKDDLLLKEEAEIQKKSLLQNPEKN